MTEGATDAATISSDGKEMQSRVSNAYIDSVIPGGSTPCTDISSHVDTTYYVSIIQ